MRCKHDFNDCYEELDAHFDDNTILMSAYCNNCSKRAKKTYILESIEVEE